MITLRDGLRALLFVALGTVPVSGQETPLPGDTFADDATEAMVRRAREARLRDIEGIESYEGLMREHIYVGLTALRFRRERGLFEQERIARLRWQSDGERAIQWLGARRAVPIVGADTRLDEVAAEGRLREAGNEVRDELRNELPMELLREADLPGFAFDPNGDRLAFGSDWALHPLADTALAEYQYALGDTLRLGLPDGRQVVLVEVRVQPRRADFHLVAGSLWFDDDSGSLVRASYKPSRPFDLAMDEPEDAEDVPGFLQPVEAEINYITVEYSLYEFRFWLPRRFALEGEARMGSFFSIPLTVEWDIRDYEVNEATTQIPATGPLPPGWSRREQRVEEDDGSVHYVTVVVPETRELLSSPELSEDFGTRTPTAFTDTEIDDLRAELQALLPEHQLFRPRLAWGLQRGMLRFNRVEGLSAGAAATVPLGATTDLDVEARIGTGDREPHGTVTLGHGPAERRWTVSGYHRLESAADYGDPFSITSSAGHLLTGDDRGAYYLATGAGLAYQRLGNRTRTTLSAFHERQARVARTTTFFLLDPLVDDTVDLALDADDVTVTGGRLLLDWFSGIDPNGFVLTGRLAGEAAGGDISYQRAYATASVTHPLPFQLAGALEVAAGSTWGDGPPQRQFFLGGASTFRGVDSNEISGESFWRARGELGTGFAGARLALFSDLAWTGDRGDFTLDDPYVSVGVGSSLLDGLVRFDLARSIRRHSEWKVYLYLDGLF